MIDEETTLNEDTLKTDKSLESAQLATVLTANSGA